MYRFFPIIPPTSTKIAGGIPNIALKIAPQRDKTGGPLVSMTYCPSAPTAISNIIQSIKIIPEIIQILGPVFFSVIPRIPPTMDTNENI